MHFFQPNKNVDGIKESIHFYLLCNNNLCCKISKIGLK